MLPEYSKKKLDKISEILGQSKLKLVHCDLCGHDNHKEILEEVGLHVVKCDTCGFVYTNPVPIEVHLSDSEEELTKDAHEADQKKTIFQGILRQLREFKDKGKLLDIGCGMGCFVQMADEAGYNSTGIDLNQRRVDYLKKTTSLDIRYGTLEKAGFKDSTFDVVALLEILEHVHAPTKLISDCNRILKENGILVIEVPNLPFQLTKTRVFRMCSRWTGTQYYGVLPFMHLVHFNTYTLERLLKKCGFRLLRSEPRKYYASPGDPILIKVARRLYNYVTWLFYTVFHFNIDTALVAYAVKESD